VAVTLEAEDFLQPEGELTLDLFPGVSDVVDVLFNGWLQQAKAKIAGLDSAPDDDNLAAAAWVYYRAAGHIANRFMNSATSATTGPISKSWASDQREYWLNYAAEKLSIWNALTPTGTTDVVTTIPAYFGTVGARRCCGRVYG